MYCPKCKQEFPGKFCPECGTKLIEPPSQNDINLNLSDNAAILGGLNVSKNETHNTTSYDQRITYNNVTHNTTKSDAQLHQEKIQEFLECCKQAFIDGLLDKEEKLRLETERLRLGLEETEAAQLIEQARKSSASRITTLSVRDSMTLKAIERHIKNNDVQMLNNQLPRLAALARNCNVDEVLSKYYMLLSALNPEKLVNDYESKVADEYWQTYWVAIAYLKCKKAVEAEEAIIKLSYYPDYPEDNSLLLSAVNTYLEYGPNEAEDYISEIYPEQCSQCLMPLIYALFLNAAPKRAEEISVDKEKCQFYSDYIVTLGSPEEEAEAEKAFEKGKSCYDEEDYTEAVKWYRKAAEQGYARAQNNLGECYYNGEGVAEDYTEAVKWFRKAAEQGNAIAQYHLGERYYYGQGVTEDETEAVKWYRKAAEQGSAIAQNKLGECYYYGLGVTKDETEAVKWYRKAAEQGYAAAQGNLGECYEEGIGVAKDYIEAVNWYRKAAEQGYAHAQYKLGFCYYYGKGVAEDKTETVKLYRKAAEQGYILAEFELEGIKVEV